MKLNIKITGIEYVNELTTYWNDQDYKKLLEMFEFPDVDQINPKDLKEMLFMAITDFEPDEAARMLLNYKLGEQLNEGQILTLSHDMMNDKVAEEYPEPELHYDLFNINQLLFKAYNGTFPNTEASILSLELRNEKEPNMVVTEEIMTKALSYALLDKTIIKRLYEDQLNGTEPFTDAAKFIWLLTKKGNGFELLTSKYWIEKEDIGQPEYECEIAFYEE